ncbi:hypothetical protein I6M49_22360 [Shewanella algae]|uniref:hypothetical protein n=1 Tax=Shewanella algae TaxID=38313 RepID=UPI001AAD152B|nr:hypothetical protein [Shewanella algae]MBO2656190.1 hypothetical protein [Shewanella algae]
MGHTLPKPRALQPVSLATETLAATTPARKDVALMRLTLVRSLHEHEQLVGKVSTASRAADFCNLVSLGHYGNQAMAALTELGKHPSHSTLQRWSDNYLLKGEAALLPAHTGRKRRPAGWHLLAPAALPPVQRACNGGSGSLPAGGA